MKLNRTVGITLERQVRDVINRRIAVGEWKPGQKLPSEAELAAEFEVHRLTVRKALESLKREGLIVPRAGSGTYVADATDVVTLSFTTDADGQIQQLFSYASGSSESLPPRKDVLLSIERETDPVVRAELRLPRAAIVRCTSILLVGDVPLMESTVWLAARTVPDIEKTWDDTLGVMPELGRRVADGLFVEWRSFSAEIASDEVALNLNVPVGSPILVREGVSVDSTGQPVVKARRRARGDRMRYLLNFAPDARGRATTVA